MINLTVVNLKEIIKRLVKIIIATILVAMIFYFAQIIMGKVERISSNRNDSKKYIKVMKSSLALFSFGDSDIKPNKVKNAKKIISSEIKLLSNEETIMEQENQEEVVEFESKLVENNEEMSKLTTNTLDEKNEQINNIENEVNSNESEDIFNIPKKAETKVNSDKNKKDSFNTTYGSVKIKNESKYTLTEDILKPDVDYSNKKDIVIFHTHTCESYTATDAEQYEPSGNFRTIDLNHSVARVGSVLTEDLTKLGYNVIHSTTYHDYPAYTGSYTRSMATVKNILQENNNIENVIDLHRDAIGSDSSYGPTVQIGDERVAQLMFVIGTNGGGLEHSNWQQNLKLAVKVQEKAEEMYPDLFKPMIVRNSRYNQNLAKGACIIEVGATGNTLEECNASMKYLASVISEVMK